MLPTASPPASNTPSVAGSRFSDSLPCKLALSAPITSLVLAFAAGDITANSRFILRGLNLSGAPHIGTPDIVQLLHDKTLAGTSASETFAIPAGFEELLLLWSDVYGDTIGQPNFGAQFNGDTGAHYDTSETFFGGGSNTTNAATAIKLDFISDTDGEQRHATGFVTISNRKGQEKVVFGYNMWAVKGGGTVEDVLGLHGEGKWRNKEDEISSIVLAPSAGNFVADSRFTILGLKL